MLTHNLEIYRSAPAAPDGAKRRSSAYFNIVCFDFLIIRVLLLLVFVFGVSIRLFLFVCLFCWVDVSGLISVGCFFVSGVDWFGAGSFCLFAFAKQESWCNSIGGILLVVLCWWYSVGVLFKLFLLLVDV